jgi:hypothetical protein
MQDYYHRYQQELKQSGFAEDEPSFIQRMRKIKKQGFYFCMRCLLKCETIVFGDDPT